MDTVDFKTEGEVWDFFNKKENELEDAYIEEHRRFDGLIRALQRKQYEIERVFQDSQFELRARRDKALAKIREEAI